MDTSEQVATLANAISEGISCLAYIRSLQADPPVASGEAILEWRKALDDLQTSLKAFEEGHIGGHVLVPSFPLSSALRLCVKNVCVHLSTIEAGVRLPVSLFQLVEFAWVELEGAIGPVRASPSSREPPRMSIEAWAAMPEDESGELVDGCLVEEEMADYEHETVVSFANAALRGWVVPRGGFVAGSEAKFAVGEEQGRKPM